MQGDKIYLSSDILGGVAFDKVEESKLVKEMAKTINGKGSSVVVGNQEKVYPVLKFGAIVDKSIGKSSIIFTARGINVDEIFTGLSTQPTIVDYSKISLENGYLNLDGKTYKNSNFNLELLFEIIQDLTAMVKVKKQIVL